MPDFDNGFLYLLVATFAYLAGSIPFGMVIAKAMNLGDLRNIGSGNIGATNVLRTGNKGAAAATLILDAFKGAVAVLVSRAIAGEDVAQIAALAAFIGHCYPVWLGFKGGKGVATFLGVLFALSWITALAACAIWLLTAVITRWSSLSALLAAGLAPVLALLTGYTDGIVLLIVLAALVYWRHGANIKRLREGTEPKIGAKS
ncbi:glycerol-3-phosphate 1-O-acyltransferase PlsY [Aestuariibius sp. 2305UL40-4]|uniref:glycerol-3-phosphate 1-O-acyltransferase PlsY n=1 Tax=Aestuariibius violaceus TaxID=3234132 RepID=UPI00345EEED7